MAAGEAGTPHRPLDQPRAESADPSAGFSLAAGAQRYACSPDGSSDQPCRSTLMAPHRMRGSASTRMTRHFPAAPRDAVRTGSKPACCRKATGHSRPSGGHGARDDRRSARVRAHQGAIRRPSLGLQGMQVRHRCGSSDPGSSKPAADGCEMNGTCRIPNLSQGRTPHGDGSPKVIFM